jgi:hypothetical protein
MNVMPTNSEMALLSISVALGFFGSEPALWDAISAASAGCNLGNGIASATK